MPGVGTAYDKFKLGLNQTADRRCHTWAKVRSLVIFQVFNPRQSRPRPHAIYQAAKWLGYGQP